MSDDKMDELERSVSCAPCFTKEQKETLTEVIRVYKGWQFVLKVIKGSTVFLGIAAGCVVAWGTIAEALKL